MALWISVFKMLPTSTVVAHQVPMWQVGPFQVFGIRAGVRNVFG